MRTGRKSIFSKDEQEYIISKYQSEPYKEIADALGFTERQVRGWVNNHCSKKNRVFNDQYFDCIDTPEKSYFLGFIYADGWVSLHQRSNHDSINYEFGMQLQRGDSYMLDALNSALGGVHKITENENCSVIAGNNHVSHTYSSVLRVYSKPLVEALVRLNITPNKTYSRLYPNVDDDLFCHFLRGYFDGDGCIYASKSQMPQVHFTAFGDAFLQHVRRQLVRLYGINSTIYAENDRKHRLMIFRKQDVQRFFDIIYSCDCNLRLERKYEKYMTLYGLAA